MTMSEQQEHYITTLAFNILTLVRNQQHKLTAFEIVGVLESIKGQILFEVNMAAAAKNRWLTKKAEDLHKETGHGPDTIPDKV
jgi:hypothetical protein